MRHLLGFVLSKTLCRHPCCCAQTISKRCRPVGPGNCQLLILLLYVARHFDLSSFSNNVTVPNMRRELQFACFRILVGRDVCIMREQTRFRVCLCDSLNLCTPRARHDQRKINFSLVLWSIVK